MVSLIHSSGRWLVWTTLYTQSYECIYRAFILYYNSNYFGSHCWVSINKLFCVSTVDTHLFIPPTPKPRSAGHRGRYSFQRGGSMPFIGIESTRGASKYWIQVLKPSSDKDSQPKGQLRPSEAESLPNSSTKVSPRVSYVLQSWKPQPNPGSKIGPRGSYIPKDTKYCIK